MARDINYSVRKCCRLPMARDINYSVRKYFPIFLGEDGDFYGLAGMIIDEGYFYHISDTFFHEVNDRTLMSNYESGHYRPHFFAIRDMKNPDIFWVVPVSSKYEKFKLEYEKQEKRYGRCTKIVLGKCDGRNAAFLVQNAFPITGDYFHHIHTSQGRPLKLHSTTAKAIQENLKSNLSLHERGVRIFFADIDRIYKLMKHHLS